MAAPFERAFALQRQLEAAADGAETAPVNATDIMSIHYRDDEAIYVIPSVDRVTVVFSTVFKEETDRIFGKVFLQVCLCVLSTCRMVEFALTLERVRSCDTQEFVDARRQPSIQNAPQVLYSNREPPLEIRSIPDLKRGEDVGYVTFGEPSHNICSPNDDRSCVIIGSPLLPPASVLPEALPKCRGHGKHDLSHSALPRLSALSQ